MPLIVPPFPKQRMLPKDILDYVSSYYIENPSRRAFQYEGTRYRCAYLTDDGAKCCAVGLLLNDWARTGLRDNGNDIANILYDGEALCDESWRPELQRLHLSDATDSETFLAGIQEWHDRKEFWDDAGQTEAGKLHLRALHQKWDHIEQFE